VQGSDPVGRFYSILRRLARLAGIDEQQIRLQFLRGLSPANQMEVRRLGIEKSPDELLPKLEEIERYTAEQLSGAYLHSNSDSVSSSKGYRKNNYSSNTGMTKEIENYVKSLMASSQSQPISSQSVSQLQDRQLVRPSQMDPGKIYRDPNLRSNDQEWIRMDETTDRLSALAGPSTLQSLIDTISKEVFDKFSSFLPKKNGGNASKNVGVDSDEELAN